LLNCLRSLPHRRTLAETGRASPPHSRSPGHCLLLRDYLLKAAIAPGYIVSPAVQAKRCVHPTSAYTINPAYSRQNIGSGFWRCRTPANAASI
jgi:hypothetical protein